MYRAMISEWGDTLSKYHTSQIRYAIEHIKSGQSEFSKFPPNCIEFGTIAKSFKAFEEKQGPIRDQPKDWRDVMIDEKVRELKASCDWPAVVAAAKASGNTLKYLQDWTKKRDYEKKMREAAQEIPF